MSPRFLLSHHPPEQEHRCVPILGRPICARCLGMYPAMLITLAALFMLGRRVGSLEPLAAEPTILILATAPALLDWARGRLRPSSGSNAFRIVTGVILGAALARTIHLHAKDPFQPPSLEVLVFLVLGVVAGVIVTRALREPGRDESPPSPSADAPATELEAPERRDAVR